LIEPTSSLSNTRLVTLTDVGRVGKTCLALAVAERIAEFCANGTWFIELAR